MKKSHSLLLAVLVFGARGLSAQTAATATAAQPAAGKQPAAKRQGTTAELLRQLKEQNEVLQQQMNQMRQQMDQVQQQAKERDRQLQLAKEAAAAAQATAAQAIQQAETAQKAAGQTTEVAGSLQTAVDDLKTNQTSLTATIQDSQKAALHPDAIHFKGVDLRPGGFLAAETVYRRRGIGGDVNTQFSGIPFAGQTAGQLSEFNASGRQSRISLLAEGKLSHSTMRGYYEADFLSAGTTSNDNSSNSYTLRQRQVWAQDQLESGLTFTGGQMWSLATETKSGLTNRTEATPLTIDAQYNVGFTWERQYGFRLVKDFQHKLWIGGAIEEAQTLNIGGHNLPTIVYQQAGNSGGLYNPTANYSYNRFPDLIGKIAYEPGRYGQHYEVYGIARFYRDRIFPNASATPASAAGAYNSKADGGGFGFNGRASVLPGKLDLGLHFLGGAGVGRYSTSTLPDVTAHPDGSLVPLQSGSALGTIEWHPTPRWDIYAYDGGEYVQRAYYLNPSGKLVGYGAPTNVMTGCNTEVLPTASANGGGNVPGSATNCTADTRNFQEATLGSWYRFYKGDRGMLQAGFQYSYAVRHTWLGVGGSPKAIENMWFTSFRYYMPQ
jgi:hypothetical protein